jgi:adenylylsulfate kinase
MKNIHTTFDKILRREAKEKLLNQKALCIWFTGLSGSGKTTLAAGLEQRLHNEGFLTQVLDGDNIRSGINNNLSFSVEDRYENIRRIAEVTKLFIDCGVITLNTFISPTDEIRAMAGDIIGKENFFEVFVDTPIEVCEQRDVKGLYQKAREGKIKNFTGIDSPFDVPENPGIVIRTNEMSIEQGVEKLFDAVLQRISCK